MGGSANAYAYYGRTLSGGLGVTYTNNTQTNQGLPFEDGDIEEERRLFYVALTRAHKKVFLSFFYTNRK